MKGLRIALGAVAAMLASAPPAMANDDLWAEVEEMIVTGSGAGSIGVFGDAAIEVQVIEKIEIESQPNLTAADAVSKLPGIRTSQRVQGERAVVSIEGLPPEYTRILVNGQRYTGQVGAVADLEDVPLTNIEEMTIKRGAQGLAQGPNSGGGVINIRTLEPPVEGVEADVWGVLGSDNKGLIAATVAGANAEQSGTSLSFTHDEIGGYDPRGSDAVFVNIGGDDSVRRTDDVYATQTFGSKNDTYAALRFGFRREEERYVNTDGIFIGDGFVDRWLGTAEASFTPGRHTTVRTALTYYDISADNNIARPTLIDDKEIRYELSATQDVELPWFGTEWKVGVDARQLVFDLDEAPLPFVPAPGEDTLTGDRDFRKLATTAGLYAAFDADFTDWLSMTAGLRLQLDTRFDPLLAPQIGFLADATDWLKFRVQYGRSDRYPSLNDLYQPAVAQNGGAYYLQGNPNLSPEKADTWRVGFEIQLEEKFSMSGTFFLNEIEDFIRFIFEKEIQVGEVEVPISIGGPETPDEIAFCNRFPTNPICSTTIITVSEPFRSNLFVRQNLEYVRTRGFEGQLRWRPTHWSMLRVGYTYMETKIDSDSLPDLNQLPNEPRHTVDFEVRLDAPREIPFLGTPTLSTLARYRTTAVQERSGTGLASFAGREATSASMIVDTRLQIPVGKAATLNFDARNLLDETTVDSNEVRGRTFYAGLRLRWPVDD